jgi:lipopolysaccharide transport system ATP-binding protein
MHQPIATVSGDIAISVDNISKSYLIGHQRVGHETFREMLSRKAREFSRIPVDLRKGRQIIFGDEVEEFWALKDVSFEVKRGEVIGIIGRNGAGKSTLLKILSRITEPTRGRAVIHGRVASLLEVGTGFHPELTGRENIYLNGAILGMTQAEIKGRFDEIVDFAEVARFLDTPVKRYSSGMYVRLAFAVAAHLEPEILIVDEVLAVGDFAFQKKCLGKMHDVAKAGRTVLFVSHNMSAVRKLCDNAILLHEGKVQLRGPTEPIISAYHQQVGTPDPSQKTAGFMAVNVLNKQGKAVSSVDDREESVIEFKILPRSNSKWSQIAFTIYNAEDIGLISAVSPELLSLGESHQTQAIWVTLPTNWLNSGNYRIEGAVLDQNGLIEQVEHLSIFHMIRTSSFDLKHSHSRGLLRFDGNWIDVSAVQPCRE